MTDDTTSKSGDSTPAKPAFEPDVLLGHTAGDAELTEELIRLCLDEGPALLGQIRKAILDRDAQGLSFASHTLKGALMNFGAQRAVAASQRLETLGREQSLDNVDEVHRELEASWMEFERELNDYLR